MKKTIKLTAVILIMAVLGSQAAYAGNIDVSDPKSISMKLQDLTSHYNVSEAEQNQELQDEIAAAQDSPAQVTIDSLSQDDFEWICEVCGSTMTGGKFCSECGAPKPESKEWSCLECGQINDSKFCSNCGSPRPGTQQQSGPSDSYSDIEFSGSYDWTEEGEEILEEVGISWEETTFENTGIKAYITDFLTFVPNSENDDYKYLEKYTLLDDMMTVGFLTFSNEGCSSLREFAQLLLDNGLVEDGWYKYNGMPVYRVIAASDKLTVFSFMECKKPDSYFAVKIDYDIMSDDFDADTCGTITKLVYDSVLWME